MFGALSDGTTCPKTTRSISRGGTPARATTSATTAVPSSTDDILANAVPALRNGVLTPATMATRSAIR